MTSAGGSPAAAPTRLVRIAHSPDADDAFMFHALSTGAVTSPGIAYEHVLRDIETLNREAERGTYEVTALSIHAFAFLHDRYALLPSGASLGDGYGPVVVARRPVRPEELRGMTVAIPGERTSAALALRLFEPEARTTVLPFDRILEAVRDGEAECGVLIHEGQLTWAEEGLHRVVDLGEWWTRDTGLPLPLGGNAVRRDLPPEVRTEVSRAITESIRHGLSHRESALDHAMRFGRGLDRARADRFVGMYVNGSTVAWGERGRRAVRLLLERGHAAGLVPAPPEGLFE